MPSRKWLSYPLRFCLLLFALLVGCTPGNEAPAESWVGVCIDMDQDGFGFQCESGLDCNDTDPNVHENCATCSTPEQGCECEADAQPIDCKLPVQLNAFGGLLCKVGTRYCRDGAWSGCEGIVEFEAPAPSLLRTQALINQDAGAKQCDECHLDCYKVEDPLTMGGTAKDMGTATADGGGITLYSSKPDGGFYVPPPILDDVKCTPGTAPDTDCDGIWDTWDPYPSDPPFSSDHDTIFMELGVGQSKSQVLNLIFYVNSADVYFYLDMTGSMDGERDNLINSLTTGNYLPTAVASKDCADRALDGTPDNDLKTAGIAGNIACLIRDARLGAGLFRDIPFYGPYANGIAVAEPDFVMFENRQDITSDVSVVTTALKGFQTVGNHNIPEGSMQGLWSVVTGGEVYAGWDRPGIPARIGCPADTWGYPCFRNNAVPIIIHITDAPMQNGPSPTSAGKVGYLDNCRDWSCTDASRNPLNYDSNVLSGMTSGTEKTYKPLTVSAESTSVPQVVGTIDDSLVTYYGNTEGMTSDHTFVGASAFGTCPQVQVCVRKSKGKCVEYGMVDDPVWANTSALSNDAVFMFHVDTGKTLTVSTLGSHFDSALVIKRIGGDGHVWCASDIGGGELNAQVTDTFTAGDYYALIKGRTNLDVGRFQITFGDTSLQTTELFAPKYWLGAAGDGADGSIRKALLDKKVRVITVNSSSDSYLAEQANVLSTATGGVSKAGAPLTFTISSDGTGMGSAVIDAVNLLAGNLAMNVSAILIETPEKPVPSFGFRVTAVDVPGDSCDPPIDTDNDPLKTPDTHVKCLPGATPRFSVMFENRAAFPVPKNPADPKGGWNMTLRLVGDKTYKITDIPVYIIPEDIIPDPGPQYAPMGTYDQRVTATGCKTNEAPSWRNLTWSAKLPAGTRLVWQMCGGDTDAELDSCTLNDVADVRPGIACTMQSQCPNGWCDPSGVCQTATGPACDATEPLACGENGVCVAGACMWTGSSSVDLKPAANSGLQGRSKVRIRAVLYSNTDRSAAPIVQSWKVNYVCTQQE